MKKKQYVSGCCRAEIRISKLSPDFVGDVSHPMLVGTCCYVCKKCGNPCNRHILITGKQLKLLKAGYKALELMTAKYYRRIGDIEKALSKTTKIKDVEICIVDEGTFITNGNRDFVIWDRDLEG